MIPFVSTFKSAGRKAGLALGLAATMIAGGTSGALAAGYAVHANCSVSPCVIGVAEPGYAGAGTARRAEGWRQKSQTYSTLDPALRTLCRWHYGNPQMSAPGVISGEIPCASLCNGNASCQ